jgi:antitoxin (DNA-binding transcriptional repressor) of toxin-antitoxin stability system
MLKTVKVQEAKTHLSALLARVEGGEEVLIARGDIVVARLTPVGNLPARDLGFVPYDVPQSFFDELPESEIGLWES